MGSGKNFFFFLLLTMKKSKQSVVSAACPALTLSYRTSGEKTVTAVCSKMHDSNPSVHCWFAISWQQPCLLALSQCELICVCVCESECADIACASKKEQNTRLTVHSIILQSNNPPWVTCILIFIMNICQHISSPVQDLLYDRILSWAEQSIPPPPPTHTFQLLAAVPAGFIPLFLSPSLKNAVQWWFSTLFSPAPSLPHLYTPQNRSSPDVLMPESR